MADKLPMMEIADLTEGENIIAEQVTLEAFLKHYGEAHVEWVMGKVISVVSNNTQHQILLLFLSNLLNLFLGFQSLGRVLLAGVPMVVSGERPAREPDLMVILNANLTRIKTTYVDGPADVAVEIVSPESTERDRGRKFAEYEAAKVPEYWLFDPERREAVFYSLGEDQRYHPLLADQQGRLTSHILPGFALHPDLIWREEPVTGEDLITLARQMVQRN